MMEVIIIISRSSSSSRGAAAAEVVASSHPHRYCCGMGRKTKGNYRNTCNSSSWVLFSLLIFFIISGLFMEMGEARKNDDFNRRNPLLERSSSSMSSGSVSSSSQYKKERLLYSNNNNNDNGMTMMMSGMNNRNNRHHEFTRNLLRSSTSALLDNSALLTSSGTGGGSSSGNTRRGLLYHQQQQQHQLENNRVATMITPDEKQFILQTNSNRNNNNNRRNRNSAKKKAYPPRPASVNSILSLESALTVWEDTNTICHKIPGLTREQMELCIRAPETTRVAIQGIQMATDECAFQMSKHRWNCSAIQGSVNPHGTQMFKKGYRESAFGHAIAAAGVAYAVAKACSQGKLLSCGCGFQYDDQVNYVPSKEADYSIDESNDAIFSKGGGNGGGSGRGGGGNSISSWKWSGCSHNMDYGMKFAKLFLDSREKSHDLPALTNLHNNKVGRVAVSANMEVRCKCHGLSGSCELRTCWRSPPEFRRVGSFLKNKFRRAIMIDQSELGNRPLSRVQKLNKQRRKRRDRETQKRSNANIDLWYYERSPNYCESNKDFSIPGTSGRRCNTTAARGDMGSCSTLCCGRGYNTIRQVYTTRCNCQFIWCCQVTCRNCTVDEWITVCK